ncbi:MAG TPA: glycosyltransferase [Phycisphaerae bacterium]
MIQEFTSGRYLTIYVLAYENAECVRALLGSLVPLNRTDVCVVVADNSDQTTNVRNVVEEFVSSDPDRIRYMSHGVNLGLVGGILRPFEIVKSTYVWIVGACNMFPQKALDVLMPHLHSRQPDVLLHFENGLWRRRAITEERTYESVISFLRDHSHSVACSINSMIYRTEKMRPLVGLGYEAASCLAPMAAMVYQGLEEKQLKVLYLPLIIFNRPERKRSHWSMLQLLGNLACTFPRPGQRNLREIFFHELNQTDAWIHFKYDD